MEKAYDENYRYERIKLDANILEQVIFEEDASKRLIFSVSELRKLDLSEIDFAGVYISETDLSYTNANINPQTVAGKCLKCTNLAGLDLRGKDFTDVNIDEANLSNTGAKIEEDAVDAFVGTIKKLVKAKNTRAVSSKARNLFISHN